jgi:hypothetical protein
MVLCTGYIIACTWWVELINQTCVSFNKPSKKQKRVPALPGKENVQKTIIHVCTDMHTKKINSHQESVEAENKACGQHTFSLPALTCDACL